MENKPWELEDVSIGIIPVEVSQEEFGDIFLNCVLLCIGNKET